MNPIRSHYIPVKHSITTRLLIWLWISIPYLQTLHAFGTSTSLTKGSNHIITITPRQCRHPTKSDPCLLIRGRYSSSNRLSLHSHPKKRTATIDYHYSDDDNLDCDGDNLDYDDDDLDYADQGDIGESYDVSDDWEWVTYKSTQILLPPPSNETPQSILHFIGGTIIGSAPTQFYRPFLQKIASQTNSILVASSIPIVLSSNPLDHHSICLEMSNEFDKVYRHVLWEEYGRKDVNNMKIIGLGHSLGSRLHCILSMSQHNYDYTHFSRRTKSIQRKLSVSSRRDGNVLMAFTNYNAMSSIPGLADLRENIEETKEWKDKQRYKRKFEDRRKTEEERRREAYDHVRRSISNDDDDERSKVPNRRDIFDYDRVEKNYKRQGRTRYKGRSFKTNYDSKYKNNMSEERYDGIDDDFIEDRVQRPRSSSRSNRHHYEPQRRYYDYNYDYDDEEDNLEELFKYVSDNFQSKVSSLKSALTPDWNKSTLEFKPSPEDLWSQIRRGDYANNVQHTLLVQFEEDEIDQSSRLAKCILDSKRDIHRNAKSERSNQERVSLKGDVKFARLRGSHLTPVNYPSNVRSMQRLLSVPIEMVMNEIRGQHSSPRSIDMKQHKNDLVQSIVMYVNLIKDE